MIKEHFKDTEKTTIGFDQLPVAVATLLEEVRELKALISGGNEQKQVMPDKVWMNLDELREYLPDHPSKPTVYGWVCNRQIPYYKVGRRLSFLQSEIDEWVNRTFKKTAEQLEQEAFQSHGYSKGGRV